MKNENSFTLRLSEDQLKTLREIAEREKRTVSAVIRNLIDEVKKTNPKKT
jgi:predicted transcriptional regulator